MLVTFSRSRRAFESDACYLSADPGGRLNPMPVTFSRSRRAFESDACYLQQIQVGTEKITKKIEKKKWVLVQQKNNKKRNQNGPSPTKIHLEINMTIPKTPR